MRNLARVLAAATAVAALAVSCASTGPSAKGGDDPQKTGFLHGYYQYLEPGPPDGAKMRWIKPGVDFGKYNRVMLDSIIFYFAEDSQSKGIDGNEMKTLADACNQAFVDIIRERYPIVTAPAPDVLRLRAAITDLRQSRPALSVVTTVIPAGMGVSALKRGVTGAWTGSGATSAEVMALDSMTNEVIAVAQDEKTAGFTQRFTKWGSAEEAFAFWGQRVKLLLDRAHMVQP